MRTPATIVSVLVATSIAYAQDPQPGVVVDAATGAPIRGATVTVAGDELTTAVDGSFAFADVPAGRLDVFVLADGYEPLLATRTRGGTWRFALRADASLAAGELITIEAEAPAITQPLPYDLRGDEVRVLPGSGNDALKGLQSLPGTARVPFGLGGLALRGSAPRDSAVYLDGLEVPILYHFGGLASFYPSSLLGTPPRWSISIPRSATRSCARRRRCRRRSASTRASATAASSRSRRTGRRCATCRSTW